MNKNIACQIRRLHELSIQGYQYLPFIKASVSTMNYWANKHSSSKYDESTPLIIPEIRKKIFILLQVIPNCRGISSEFITIFSDLIIEFIQEESKQQHDISDLISAFDKMSVSLNSSKSPLVNFSNLQI
jgi:hypothetical protein